MRARVWPRYVWSGCTLKRPCRELISRNIARFAGNEHASPGPVAGLFGSSVCLFMEKPS